MSILQDTSIPAALGVFRKTSIGLMTVATVLSIGLAISSGAEVGCRGTGGSCSEVLGSPYAWAGPVPVSILGALLYLLTAVAILFRAQGIGRVFSWTVILAAVWFVGLQLFVLHAFCVWCSTVHFLATVSAILFLRRMKIVGNSPPEKSDWLKTISSTPASFGIALCGVLSLALLSIYLPTPDRSRSTKFSEVSASTMTRLGENIGLFTMANGSGFGLMDRSAEIERSALPMVTVGVHDDREPLLLLSDWTCPHCRQLHQSLNTSRSGVILPSRKIFLVPGYRDPEARAIHRLMLLAWNGDPKIYERVASKIVSGSTKSSPDAVKALMVQLTGGLWKSWEDRYSGRVDEVLAFGQEMVAQNDRFLKVATFPQLVSKGEILSGLPSAKALAAFLERTDSSIATSALDTSSPAATNDSRIEFSNQSLILPPVKAGESAPGIFDFTNTGTEPLAITGIRTSCGCAAVEGWKQIVGPGKTGSLKVNFTPIPGMAGITSKSIMVLSNARNVAATDGASFLNFSCEVIALPQPAEQIAAQGPGEGPPQGVTLSASSINFGKVIGGTGVSAKTIEISIPDPDLRLDTSPKVSGPFSATILSGQEQSSVLSVLLDQSATTLMQGSAFGSVALKILTADDEGKNETKELLIPLRAYILPSGGVRFSNTEIKIPGTPLADAFIAEWSISAFGSLVSGFKIAEASVLGHPEISVDFSADPAEPWRWKISANFPKGFSLNSSEASPVLRIRRSPDTAPVVDVPIVSLGMEGKIP